MQNQNPAIGSVWKHKSGETIAVYVVANTIEPILSRSPILVTYIRHKTGDYESMTLEEWSRSCIFLRPYSLGAFMPRQA